MDIISDMTRQYKSVFEQLCNQQERLERRFADNVEEITRLDNEKKALVEATAAIKGSKESEIAKLKKSIEEMS